VRRSHRTELTEVPGAIPGRTSLDVEVSAMSGIPQAALEAFEEKLAEEMLAARVAPPSIDEIQPPQPQYDEDDEEPAPPSYNEVEPPRSADTDDGKVHTPLLPELAVLASTLANQLTDQSTTMVVPKGSETQSKPTAEIKAFDRAKLAARLAAIGEDKDLDTGEAVSKEAELDFGKPKPPPDEPKKAEKMSFSFFKKEDVKPAEAPKPVSKIDKSAVEDLGFAAAARAAAAAAAAQKAAAAAAARPPPPPKPKPLPSFRTKLMAMEDFALLKYAKEVGVSEADVNSTMGSPDAKQMVTEMVMELESKESWLTVTFKPGKLGLKPEDWKYGKVKMLTPGHQAETLGVKPGWVFVTVDGEKFSKALVQEKIAGASDYKVVFATNPGPGRFARRPRPPARPQPRAPPPRAAEPPPDPEPRSKRQKLDEGRPARGGKDRGAGRGRTKGEDAEGAAEGKRGRGRQRAEEEYYEDEEEYSYEDDSREPSPAPQRGRGHERQGRRQRYEEEDGEEGGADRRGDRRGNGERRDDDRRKGGRRDDYGSRRQSGAKRNRDAEEDGEMYDPEDAYDPEAGLIEG